MFRDRTLGAGRAYFDGNINVYQAEDHCLADLRVTDPRDDKIRIEQTKGGLLKASYRWILDNENFRQWRDDEDTRLLWIKGDPGKGKTMLVCGIINELSDWTETADQENNRLLSYFFCQAADARINSGIAVLRGLIYLLVCQRPSLIVHVRRRYEHVGKALFEDANAWVALSRILDDILHDSGLGKTYLVIDALDECLADLPSLLDLIVRRSAPSCVKWVVSSRDRNDIERHLRVDGPGTCLSLELKQNAEQVSYAVDTYIEHCVVKLPALQGSEQLQAQVRDMMRQKANGTFLWVALVVQELTNAESWEVLGLINKLPAGLQGLYRQMLRQIQRLGRGNPEICRRVLSTVAAYRPLQLQELSVLADLRPEVNQSMTTVIRMCGSFLTIKDDSVYIIHQSAKDFLCTDSYHEVFKNGLGHVHQRIFSRSLELMHETLKRDMYGLRHPGFPIDRIKAPSPDPLVAVQYSCVYWIDHLLDSKTGGEHGGKMQDGGEVHRFLTHKSLYWLESLSLLKSTSWGVLSISRLHDSLKGAQNAAQLIALVRDAYRFLMYFKWPLERNPLQVYVSALVFSPDSSPTRTQFTKEKPTWIVAQPSVEQDWSPCLQTIESTRGSVYSVTFSPEGRYIAVGANKLVQLWDVATGQCLRTFVGSSSVKSVAFSPSGRYLASACRDSTVKIWDTATGQCCQTLDEHVDRVLSVAFSPDGKLLASGSGDQTVKLWNATTWRCSRTLHGDNGEVNSVAFSPDSRCVLSASIDCMVWDTETGQCRQTLESRISNVNSAAFSPDGRSIVSAHNDYTGCIVVLREAPASRSPDMPNIKLWDVATGHCLRSFRSHGYEASSVAFSPNSRYIASASGNKVEIWDVATGQCLQTLNGHAWAVTSVSFSPDGKYVVSASYDATIKLWDAATRHYRQALRDHDGVVQAVTISSDEKLVASASTDKAVKVWDAVTGQCLQTFWGHEDTVNSVAFSPGSTCVASGSQDRTIRLWDIKSGQCLRAVQDDSRVRSLAFSPNGMLASASGDIVKLWDAATGQCLQMLAGHNHEAKVYLVTFSPNGSLLASASAGRGYDGGPYPDIPPSIKLWDVATGRCCQTFNSSAFTVPTLSFDSMGSRLYTGSGIILWDTFGSMNTIMSPIFQFLRPPSYLEGYAISSNRMWITWNSEKLLWLPPENRPETRAIAGSTIVLGCASGRVLIFRLAYIVEALQ